MTTGHEIVWTSGAGSDFIQAKSGQSDEDQFIYGIDSALYLLRHNSEMGPRVPFLKNHRRLLVGKHKEFGIFYTVVGQRILISAMVKLTQSPEKIVEVLKGRGAI